jgi:lipopolysaccharide transport system permease protein
MSIGKPIRQISQNQPLSDWLRQLIERRETLWFFIWKDLKVQYQQPVFGLVWSVFQPLIYFGVILLLRSTATTVAESDMPFELYLLTGLVVWNFTTSVISGSVQSLQSNAGLISKSFFPRFYLVLSPFFKGMIDLFIMFALVVALAFYYAHYPSSISILFIPLALMMLCVTVVSWSSIGVALIVYNRHIRHAVPVFLYALIFALPVFYQVEKMDSWALDFLYLANPIAGAMDCIRASFGGSIPSSSYIVSWISQSIMWLIIGVMVFRKTEKNLVDKV